MVAKPEREILGLVADFVMFFAGLAFLLLGLAGGVYLADVIPWWMMPVAAVVIPIMLIAVLIGLGVWLHSTKD